MLISITVRAIGGPKGRLDHLKILISDRLSSLRNGQSSRVGVKQDCNLKGQIQTDVSLSVRDRPSFDIHSDEHVDLMRPRPQGKEDSGARARGRT